MSDRGRARRLARRDWGTRPGWASRLALRAYPPTFRERYGAELATLVDDVEAERGSRLRDVVDLVDGAVRAWLRPALPTAPSEARRRRLQASVATTWVAWCAGFMVAPTVNRAVLDPPLPGVSMVARRLLEVAQVTMFVGWGLALLAGAPLGLRVVALAARGRDRAVLGRVAPAVALLAVETAGFGALWLLRRGHPAVWPRPSAVFVVVGVVWLAGFCALVAAGGIGLAAALAAARPPAEWLRVPALLALPVAAALAGTAMASAGAVLLTGGATGYFGAVPTLTALVASVVGVTSAARGTRAALRT